MVVSVSPVAGCQVEFKITGSGRCSDNCIECLSRQSGTAEIGMQHGTGQIENREQTCLELGIQTFRHQRDYSLHIRQFSCCSRQIGSDGCQGGSDDRCNQFQAVPFQ